MTNVVVGKDLDRSMARAVAWNAAAKWITQILSWLSTIVVARLLTPGDYGLVGMAGVYLSLATLISQIGIAEAVLTLRDLTHRQIAELNSVALLMGIALVGVSGAVAAPLARFFSAPQLHAVIIVCSSTYIINALQVVPSALLQKELRFKLLSALELVRAVFQIVVTVVLAFLGYGYWTLVYGVVAGSFMASILTLFARRHAFARPNFPGLRRELRFSGHVLTSGIGNYIYSNADFLVAGRMLGQVPLGDYTVAWTISCAPIEKIGNLITRVTPAFFAAVQHDRAELRRLLLRLTEVLSYVTVPASIGIALVADVLVPVVLGPKWTGAIGPLRLLGISVAFRSLDTILPKLLTATGDTAFTMWATMVSAVIMPLSFFVGSYWGTNGIAAAWVIIYPLITLPLYYKAFHRISMSVREYLSSVLPSAHASLVMAAAVIGTRWLMRDALPLAMRLCLLIIIGIVAYVGALMIFHRTRVFRLLAAIRELRGKRSDKTPCADSPAFPA